MNDSAQAIDNTNTRIEHKLKFEFVRAFLSMGPISVAADIFIASLVLYFAWSEVHLPALLFAYTILIVLNIQLFFTYLSYKKTPAHEQEDDNWYRKTRILTLTHGAGWGIFSATAFFATNSQGFIYIMLILLTLTISAVPVLSQLFTLFVARTLLMLTPTAILVQVFDRFDYPTLIYAFQVSFPLLVLILGYLQFLRSTSAAKLDFQKETMLKALDREIEERKGFELNLRKAVREAEEANAAKSRFLASISHEIRTPLTAIRSLSELIHNSETLDPALKKPAEIIRRNSHHLNAIINDVLDMAKVQSGKLSVEKQLCNIPRIIMEICEDFKILSQEKGLEFSTEFDFPLPIAALSDPTRIRQIVFNLLNNALKFTQQGSIKVRTQYTEENRQLSIQVIDTGIGLSQAQLKRIFNPFEQAEDDTSRQFGGTGLGLSISKELAHMLNGDIDVTSKEKQGSCFNLTITLNDVPNDTMAHSLSDLAGQSQESAPTEQLQLEGRVLVAEDNKDIRFIICTMLNRIGLNTEEVTNGKQAIASVMSNHYDLILMDMNMPEMDGITATELLREQGMTTPIIGITANVDSDETKRYWDAGIDDYILKPLDIDSFYKTLSTFLPNKGHDYIDQMDKEIYEEFSDLFINSLKDAIREMKVSIESEDHEAVYRIAHDIKGQAKAYHYGELVELAEKLETLAKQGQITLLRSTLSEFQAQCKPLFAA